MEVPTASSKWKIESKFKKSQQINSCNKYFRTLAYKFENSIRGYISNVDGRSIRTKGNCMRCFTVPTWVLALLPKIETISPDPFISMIKPWAETGFPLEEEGPLTAYIFPPDVLKNILE